MPTLDEAVETASQPAIPEPQASPPAPAPAPAAEPTTAPETPAEPAEPDPSKLFLLTKKEAPAPTEPEPTPEEKEKGYLRQSDYTRKTQELADRRRAFETEQVAARDREERYLKLIETLKPEATRPANGEETVFDRVRSLREDGNHEEADKLLFELGRQETKKELDPVIRNAKAHELQATFVNTAIQTSASDPVVRTYAKQVAARFDGDEVLDPATGVTMSQLRAAITVDGPTMQKFVPLVMRSLALEEHSRYLESEMAKIVSQRVESGLQAERNRAKAVPGRLVPGGSPFKETTSPGRMSLDEALKVAEEKLSTS